MKVVELPVCLFHTDAAAAAAGEDMAACGARGLAVEVNNRCSYITVHRTELLVSLSTQDGK